MIGLGTMSGLLAIGSAGAALAAAWTMVRLRVSGIALALVATAALLTLAGLVVFSPLIVPTTEYEAVFEDEVEEIEPSATEVDCADKARLQAIALVPAAVAIAAMFVLVARNRPGGLHGGGIWLLAASLLMVLAWIILLWSQPFAGCGES